MSCNRLVSFLLSVTLALPIAFGFENVSNNASNNVNDVVSNHSYDRPVFSLYPLLTATKYSDLANYLKPIEIQELFANIKLCFPALTSKNERHIFETYLRGKFLGIMKKVDVNGNGPVVGNFVITRCGDKFNSFNKRLDKYTSYIGKVCTNPNYRGQGLGKMMLKYVIPEYSDRTYTAIICPGNPAGCKLALHVLDDNDPAKHLYDTLGFKTTLKGSGWSKMERSCSSVQLP
ncbi:MAG: GNAT family N-acetyltransferase [Oligoflexia bacterium]|nr:GNAT family N-acetyltransferase [Oligoflexia bacterium]